MEGLGIQFRIESPSNQLFPTFSNNILKKLEKKYAWEIIEVIDEKHTEIRLVTSWATKEQDIDSFLQDLSRILETEK